jgi:hypothetical protein
MSSAAFAHEVKPTQAAGSRKSEGRLRVNRPDDAFEVEADRIAERVLAGQSQVAPWTVANIGITAPLQRKCSCAASGKCAKCQEKEDRKEEKALQRSPEGPAPADKAPPIVHDVLSTPGEPLDRNTREFFEPRFGYDLSRVRIHTDHKAAASAESVGAAAYAVGSHIVFGAGRYEPQATAGKFLLGHELTHVIQQTPALSRQPLKTEDAPAKQRSASRRLDQFATVVDSYANKASGRVSGLGSGGDLDAIRRNIATARTGVAGLRKLAARGDDRLAAAVLTNFTPPKLKAALGQLVPATVPQVISDIAETRRPELAAKSLDISQPQDRAEIEADRVAHEVLHERPSSISLRPAELGLYRLLNGADELAAEEELTGLEEITTSAGVTTEAVLAPEELAVVTTVLAGIGPVGWAVIAMGVVAVGIGIWYVASEDSVEMKKATAPSPAPASTATPQTLAPPVAKPVPEECVETAKRHSSDKCKMVATADHAGANPIADLYCEQITGDPCEYRTRGATGTAYFDSVKGDTATECKCGFLDFVRDANAGKRFAKRVLDDKLEQIRRHLRVVQDCGLKYRIIVSNDEVAAWFRGELGDEVIVELKKSEFCD